MAMSDISIKAMFEDLLLEIDLGALKFQSDFIKDLNRYYKQNGKLTEKQESALRKIYRNHIN